VSFGDGGPADKATFGLPDAVAVGPGGSVYIEDPAHRRIRRVEPDGRVMTVAGSGRRGAAGRPASGCAVDADLMQPAHFAMARDGTFFFTDQGVIWRVGPDGTISQVTPTPAISPGAALGLTGDGNLLVSDGRYRLVRLDVNGKVQPVAGTTEPSGTDGFDGDGGPATSARLQVGSTVGGPDGSVYISDSTHVLRVTPDGIIHRVAGGELGCKSPPAVGADGLRALDENFCGIDVSAVGTDGRVYVTDGNRVRVLGNDGKITTIAGVPGQRGGFSGDGAAATAAQLYFPTRAAVDPGGGFYIADNRNHRIRRVGSDGTITTYAGSGPVTEPTG